MTPDAYHRLCREFPVLASGARLSQLEERLVGILAGRAHNRAARERAARGAGGPATSLHDARAAWVSQIRAQEPVALLVGEAPGPRSDPSCPLFPLPEPTSGGRLLSLAGYANDPLAYLSLYARADVVTTFPMGTWPRAAAAANMAALMAWAAGLPIILLGARAALAAGMGPANKISTGYVRAEHYRWMDAARFGTAHPMAGIPVIPSQAEQPVIWLPHPSGHNRLTSMAGASFMDAFRTARIVGMARVAEAGRRRLREMTAAAGGDAQVTEQCGQCGEVILGYHRCVGVPGDVPDEGDGT